MSGLNQSPNSAYPRICKRLLWGPGGVAPSEPKASKPIQLTEYQKRKDSWMDNPFEFLTIKLIRGFTLTKRNLFTKFQVSKTFLSRVIDQSTDRQTDCHFEIKSLKSIDLLLGPEGTCLPSFKYLGSRIKAQTRTDRQTQPHDFYKDCRSVLSLTMEVEDSLGDRPAGNVDLVRLSTEHPVIVTCRGHPRVLIGPENCDWWDSERNRIEQTYRAGVRAVICYPRICQPAKQPKQVSITGPSLLSGHQTAALVGTRTGLS
ncbi:hypothetical protein J6590_015278 [Homalodisca vitripennis]|nr:hypothetical protein J6590_015278 [Homalodisca vitripennis]